MIQFLYEGGHGPRAQALSNVTPGSRCGGIDLAPSTLTGLDTLAFWGHGDQYKLCGKTPREIHEVIKAWKQLNPGISTVEIITCNARHNNGTGDSFAKQLKDGIGVFSSLRGLKIKALPTNVSGRINAWSILLAETAHNSWCYITAPGADDSLLMQARKLIEYDQGPKGSISYKGDIAAKANKIVSAAPMTRQWTMNYGYFNTLRACLGSV